MKLLTKTNSYYMFFSIITYLMIGVAVYFTVQYLIYQEVEERLLVEKKDFENFIQARENWEKDFYFVENKISFEPLTSAYAGEKQEFKDVILLNKYDQQRVPFRELIFYKYINNIHYRISIRKSLPESFKLMEYLTSIMLLLLSIAFGVMYILQRKLSQNIWFPFYETLSKIKSFDLKEENALELSSGGITEFKELNEVLQKMTKKMWKDYNSLKQFSENASHEIQTPLALINLRIEELIQEKTFSEQQMYWIQEIHRSSLRLSKLNHALLLLSKLDNQQFQETETVNLTGLLRNKIEEYEEMFLLKNIRLSQKLEGEFIVRMNVDLADSLLSNLINNAIKHNLNPGLIEIFVTDNSIKISNTGLPLTIQPEKLFERFRKAKTTSESLGLGLAIVKEICHYNGMEVDYSAEGSNHVITIFKRN